VVIREENLEGQKKKVKRKAHWAIPNALFCF